MDPVVQESRAGATGKWSPPDRRPTNEGKHKVADTQRTTRTAVHPLEPLTAKEITAAARIIRAHGGFGDGHRFASIALHEPPKEKVLGVQNGNGFEREAFAVLLDRSDGATYEAVASLSGESVTLWERVPRVQPQVMLEEFFECEEIVKAAPGFREAAAKRGIEDLDSVMVDPWSAGHYGDEEEGHLIRALAWVKIGGPDDNGPASDEREIDPIRYEEAGIVENRSRT